VGNGTKINLWRDNWIPRENSQSLKISGSVRLCRLRRVSHLINQDSNSWDETKLRRYFHIWDVDEILKIKIPAGDTEDLIAWHYEKSGVFSVRSAYRLALACDQDLGAVGSSLARNGELPIWKKLWKVPVPPKVRIFAWKLINDGMPTNANHC